MARGWYSYHEETPQAYFEEQYEIYIDTDRKAWERYNAANRLDAVMNWILDMPNENWIENYVIDRSQKRFDQIKYNPSYIEEVAISEREATAYQHYFYIVELYDKYDRLIWTKIGATKHFNTRMKQIYSYYPEVWTIRKRLLVNTEDIPAEEVESKVRTYLLKKYGRAQYVPNDRFARKINVEEIAEKIPQLLENLRKAEMK